MQLALTLVFYAWLIIVLVLLYLMWRDGSRRVMLLQQALIDVSNKSADAAKTAAETAQKAIVLVEEKIHDA